MLQALHALMHFLSSLKPSGMNSSGPQERRISDQSHPTQILDHPQHQRHVALHQPCLKSVSQGWGPPRHYPCSPAIDLSVTQPLAMVPLTGAGWSTAQDPKRQILHLEQDVLLKLTLRWVWDRRLSLSAQKLLLERSLQATHLLQLQESKSENDPSTEKQITALLHFLITFSFW